MLKIIIYSTKYILVNCSAIRKIIPGISNIFVECVKGFYTINRIRYFYF